MHKLAIVFILKIKYNVMFQVPVVALAFVVNY